ncbi:hypothetical protein P2H44_10490 [Albimonas sp. CAU 1670]|uniref:hypothetical protein n=1 Tax=Albimonas sp. CAU 1670 TaxID=3032599 RepID=UPI0023DACA68|nr:hypothetical protein [Albimonas sp. CAU 1670]MDF2232982.1 hypothetical protein [Albimonas sp. CAU 1670]
MALDLPDFAEGGDAQLDAPLDAPFDALFEDAAPRLAQARLDRFEMPAAARAEFLEAVRVIHAVLRRRPGFLRDLLLERTLPDGRVEIATLVEWGATADLAAAKVEAARAQAAAGIDPAALMARLGVQATIASFEPVEGGDEGR